MSKKILPFLFLLTSCAHQSHYKSIVHSDEKITPSSYEVKNLNIDSPAELQQTIKTTENYLAELLRPSTDPYYAKPDKSTSCYSDFIQSRKQYSNDVADITQYQLQATADHQFGLCHPTKDIYNTRLYFVFCKAHQKSLQIKIFWPLNRQAEWRLNLNELCYH